MSHRSPGPRLLRALAILLLASTPFAQTPGAVLSDQKISDTAGGFAGTLTNGDAFGRSVTHLGDLDGDGIPEVAVGAVYDTDGGSSRGAVWILFLNADATVSSAQKISATAGGFGAGLDAGDLFGFALTSLGDLDGDGVEDLAVGAPHDDDGGSDRGAVHVLFLNANGTVKSQNKIGSGVGGFTGVLDDVDNFGTSLAYLGDLDGDGKPELAVGAIGDDDGGPVRGAVWILTLNSDGTVALWNKISATSGGLGSVLFNGDRFGRDVTSLGDLDGDGRTDIAVSAGQEAPNNRGALWILFLNTDGSVRANQKITERLGGFQADLTLEDRFGTALELLGDLDGNGTNDLAVGALDDEGGVDRGAVYILFLRNDGTVLSHQKIASGRSSFTGTLQNTDLFGSSLANLGDLNGDGTSELMVGAVQDDDGGPNRGALYALFLEGGPAAAPAAEFAALPSNGDAPLTVAFQDTTTGNVFQWSWDFGDGSNSNLQNPAHTYTLPGTYSVSLTATGLGGTDTEAKTDVIVVTAPPLVAGFQITPPQGPAPLAVQFSDLSTGGATTWSWDFGDGGTSTAQNPTHTYATPGTYSVALTVTGAMGSDTADQPDAVVVTVPAPVASFTATPTTGPDPLTVAFTDASTGDVTSWTWTFGDGGTASTASPTHTYEDPGTYTVGLTVRGPGGLDANVQPDLIVVAPAPPVAAFNPGTTTGVAPLAVVFEDLSTGAITAWSWDFGDGNGSTDPAPTHTYENAGTFSVSLTTTGPGGNDTATQTDVIVVEEPAPTVAFSASPTSGDVPLTVVFTDASTGDISAWSWDFGDGGSASTQNPSHTYTSAGTFTVTLTATGSGGTTSESQPDVIVVSEVPPVAAFDGQPASGDAPLTVTFSDQSTGAVTAWTWAFGDGGTSTEENPVHTYTAAGTYTVSLTATNGAGSNTADAVDYVVVTEPIGPPVPAFEGAPTQGYAPLTVAFLDQSSGDATTWSWTFGDGGSSTLQGPSHSYDTPGTYTVTLTVTGPGGFDSLSKADYVVVLPAPVFMDGSFEDQLAAGPPTAPWVPGAGSAHLVAPITVSTDGSMPTNGLQWVELSSAGTNAALPPSNPGGEGTLPSGVATLTQDFVFDVNRPYLALNLVFVNGEAEGSTTSNDFASVDVSDGTTTHNLAYLDTFSAQPGLSSRHGLAMTDLTTAAANLAALFPLATGTTVLTLTLSVGNGGDGDDPSFAYVDQVLFGPAATALLRNGTGANPVCYQATPPVIGEIWTAQVDTTSHPGASFVWVGCYAAAHPGFNVPAGEVLVDIFSSPLLFTISTTSSGAVDTFALRIPRDLSLVGHFGASQGFILGGGFEICNAIDLTLGF